MGIDGSTTTLAEAAIDTGSTAWLLIGAALVLFMVPGLALFYGGMVGRRSVLAMLQQNMVPIAVITITWVVFGYSLAFSDDVAGFIGDLELFGLSGLGEVPANPRHLVEAVSVPTLAFVAYQMMFAIITPALATGAVANRMKILGWTVLLVAWSIIVYPPIVHWLWNPQGWLTKLGAQDWAGGIVVHASAGAAALALLVILGRRRVWPDRAPLPHSIPLVVLAAGVLWFGWFGFNGADGLLADGLAAQAVINTQVAGATAMAVWLLMERWRTGRSTVLGGVTGAVAGLATITPAAGFVDTYSALIIGLLAGLVCNLALGFKNLLRFDDALDVIAVHFFGGVLGTLLVGFFGHAAVNSSGRDGLFYGGGGGLLLDQVVALAAVIAYSFVLTLVIAWIIDKTIGLRVRPEDEAILDEVQQHSQAYTDAPPVSSSAPDAAEAGLPALPEQPRLLITAVMDGTALHGGTLRPALLDAGADSILVSDAQRAAGSAETRIVRGDARVVGMPDRLRLEIVAQDDRYPAIAAVLRDAGGLVDLFAQEVRHSPVR